MSTKYNFSSCSKPHLITPEMVNRMIANLARIGIDSISPDNIHQVIKRTNLANECNLQIIGFILSTPVTVEEIQRMMWFRTNIDPIPPQRWFPMMKKQFPYVIDFGRLMSKAQAAGWEVSERGENWLLMSSEDNTNVYVYPTAKYVTEKSVWQDAMMRGYFNA